MDPSQEENSSQHKAEQEGSLYIRKLLSLFKSQAPQEKNIGISFESNIVSWACIESSSYPKSPFLLSSGVDDSWDEYKKCHQTILKTCSEDRIYRSLILEPSKTLYRKISVPVTISHKNRKMALIDILEQDLPSTITLFSENDTPSPYVVSTWLQSTTDDFFLYDAYISLQSDIEEAMRAQSSLGIIDSLFPRVPCIQAWAIASLPREPLFLIIDMTIKETVILLLQKKSIDLIRSIPSGLTSLLALDEQNPTPSQIQEMRVFLDTLLECTKRATDATKGEEIPLLVLTGPISSLALYSACVSEYIEADLYKPTADQKKSFSNAAEIGAALLGSEKMIWACDDTIPDLLKPALFPTNIFRRHGVRPFLFLFLTSTLIACGIIFSAFQEKEYVQEQRKRETALFLEKIDSFPLFLSEKESIQMPNVDLLLSDSSQEMALANLQKEINKNSSYQLQPRIMGLTEVLQSLDAIIESIHQKALDESGSLKLQSLKYAMVKRPDLQHIKDPYQVRIDIDFTSSSQAMARSFYDALLLSKSLVDAKSDVKWAATNDRYKTSFYLKQSMPFHPTS
ncbi:MAG: hypothetical protein QRY74_04740 [Chlamydia sp.]